MSTSIPESTLEKFTTFGDLLKFLRRRVGITQMELSIAVGYSDAQISRLEQNLRLLGTRCSARADLPPPFGSPALYVKGIREDQGFADVASQNWRGHTSGA